MHEKYRIFPINMIHTQLISKPENVCTFMMTKTYNWSVLRKPYTRGVHKNRLIEKRLKTISHNYRQLNCLTVGIFAINRTNNALIRDNLYQDNTSMNQFLSQRILFCIDACLFPFLYHMRRS